VTNGLEMREHRSTEGFLLHPQHHLSDLETDGTGAFIIPGGDPEPILGNEVLTGKLMALNERGKLLAAICGGPLHLSRSGVLEGKHFTSSMYAERRDDFTGGSYCDQDVIEDGNIITAWPNAFVDFALALGDRLRIWVDEADRDGQVF
jgi:4-methyl-5(b-hydroxyethyl)-thiazole monophosphate biosynthesis